MLLFALHSIKLTKLTTRVARFFPQFMAKILIKNGQNICFLKKLWTKMQNIFTMVIYIIIGKSKCFEGTIFLPKRSGLAKEASFDPKTAISVMNSRFRTTTRRSLS